LLYSLNPSLDPARVNCMGSLYAQKIHSDITLLYKRRILKRYFTFTYIVSLSLTHTP